MIEEKLLNSTVLEVEEALTNDKSYIDVINQKLESNLVAIYNAVTEIVLNDANSLQKVKKLVEKQECYKYLRQQYLDNGVISTGVKK